MAYGWQSEKVVLSSIMSSCILLVQEAEGSTDIVSLHKDILLPAVRSECRREGREPLTSRLENPNGSASLCRVVKSSHLREQMQLHLPWQVLSVCTQQTGLWHVSNSLFLEVLM